MSNKSDKTITDIVEAVRESDEKKTKPYDTTATVTRVEDGKAWVHIPGGVAETPAELTINAKQGDSVMVRVAGGRAFLLGNATNPPTDDSTAETALANANDALQSAINARIAADSAEQSAEVAQASAETASTAAAQAVTDAATANANAQTAIADAAAAASAASQAQTSADSAQSSAQSAAQSANGALKGLSTVQDVIGVLDWAKDNATYTLTTDTDIVPGKTYWTRSGSGTEADPYTYTPVVTPVKADLGTYYEISGVDEAMADYINTHLVLTDEGLYVLGDANQWKVLIAPDGVYIIDGTSGVDKVVAKYKDAITLGLDDGTESYQRLDYHSLQLIGRGESTPYFWVSDLRDKDDSYQATITEIFTADGGTNTFSVQLSVSAEVSVTDSSHSSNTATRSEKDYTFASTPSKGATVTIVYKTTSNLAKAYTLGQRARGLVGAMSVAEGVSVRASGYVSHAEGYGTTAREFASHAEGYLTTASGYASHAEGSLTTASENNSHAEGYNTTARGFASHAEGDSTTANGRYSHAEGCITTARGIYSHAQNYYTVAGFPYQTAIGKYNYNKSDTALEIGNGTSSKRSNAHEFTWDGDVRLALDTSATSGTDKEIYDALVALGWASDVIG